MKKLFLLLLSAALGLSAAEKIYLFNGLGDQGTLSKVENGAIANNVANVGKYPNDIKYQNGKLFVLNSGTNNIKIINESNLSDAGSIELHTAASNPWKMSLCNGKIYVTSLYGTGVEVWSAEGTYLKTITIPDIVPGAGTTAIQTVGSKVFVNRSNLTYDANYNATYGIERMFVINSVNDELIGNFTSGINVAAMLTDNENELHVLCTGNRGTIGGYVKTFNTTTYANIDSIYLGSQPGAFCLSGTEMLVAVSGQNPDYSGFGGVMKYNATTNQVINGGSSLLYSNAASGIMDICVDASGKAYLPIFSSNQLVVLNGSTVSATWTAGNGPQGLCYVNTTDIANETEKAVNLISAYPNPFNNSTRISFNLTQRADIKAAIYNQNGQFVQNLLESNYGVGTYAIDFNANGLNSGVYFIKLTSGNQQIGIQKLLFCK